MKHIRLYLLIIENKQDNREDNKHLDFDYEIS